MNYFTRYFGNCWEIICKEDNTILIRREANNPIHAVTCCASWLWANGFDLNKDGETYSRHSHLMPIRIHFENGLNYVTDINARLSLAEILRYWLGKYFIQGDEKTSLKCVCVEIDGRKYI